jgi:hypothetical protein
MLGAESCDQKLNSRFAMSRNSKYVGGSTLANWEPMSYLLMVVQNHDTIGGKPCGLLALDAPQTLVVWLGCQELRPWCTVKRFTDCQAS